MTMMCSWGFDTDQVITKARFTAGFRVVRVRHRFALSCDDDDVVTDVIIKTIMGL